MISFFTVMLLSQFFLMTLVFPYMLDEGQQWLKTTVSSLLVVWLLSAFVVQLLGPGTVKPDNKVTLMNLLDEFDAREICPTCKVIMLPRSRHCNICNVCVDRYDHHCQWLNNCVGRRNHGYFLFFVFVQAAYLFFVTATLAAFYIGLYQSENDNYVGKTHDRSLNSNCGT